MIRKRNRHALARANKQHFGRLGGIRSQQVQAEQRLSREIDADTLLARARHDARGQIVREGHTYTAKRVYHWQVVRSAVGQHRQYDLLVDGKRRATLGVRGMAKRIRVARDRV